LSRVSEAAARRAFDGLERWLAPLAARRPGPALAAAEGIGRLRNRLSARWPSPEQVQALFPHLDRLAAARVAWSLGGLEARNRLLVACLLRAGLAPIRPLVRTPPEAFAGLRPPRILGTFHVGVFHALSAALERLPGPVLALRQGRLYAPAPPLEIASTEGDSQLRAAVFRRALVHLERGGFLALALDEVPGPGLRVPFLGRELALARGPFALARITGAPLAPIVARWREGGIEFEIGEALAAGPAPGLTGTAEPLAWESALAAAAAGWLERYLLASPSETGLGLLRALLA
jgi:hypothetical protein